MALTITNPHGDDSPVAVDQPVFFEATDLADWTASVNGGAPSTFATNTRTAVYTTPATVANADGSGNKGVDVITITATDRQVPPTSDSTTILLVQGVPAINCTYVAGPVTSTVSDPNPDPVCTAHPAGVADTAEPVAADLVDEDNETPDAEDCPAIHCTHGDHEECEACPSTSPVDVPTGGNGTSRPDVATPRAGGQGLVRPEPMFCNLQPVAMGSVVAAARYGKLQVKSGCGKLPTRGVSIELCTFFASTADGLAVAAERIAGKQRAFGWQVRLIQDTAGNVALYWGDRRIEGWKTTDGGSTFAAPRGSFGSLTKQGDGSFTRTSKDCVYFDFDPAGRLQKIRDRSQDGNLVYFNYNGSNQVIRIVGPGMGFEPYFTYDGSGRVNSMNLEGTSPERTTYYDYDASGRMTKVIGPENCIRYFDYDANDNVKEDLDPDNYRAYFQYGAETEPRIKEVNLPEAAGLYFAYDDAAPWGHVLQAGCASGHYFEYQWAGLPRTVSSIPVHFSYCPDAKPERADGSDGNQCYYEWDSSGQLTSIHCCEDATTYYTYGPCGTVTSRKDALGRVTYWNYDANGLQTNWIDALGNVTYFERDSFGKTTSRKDPNGNLTYFTYDVRGRHTSTEWAGGGVRYYDYNDAGEIEVLLDELGNVAYYDRDLRGRIVKWKDFQGQATEYAYDNRSNRTIMLDRRGNAWYWEYDGLSRNASQKTPLGNETAFGYEKCNLLSNTVDPLGNPAYFYYDAEKRLQAREDALAERTYFEYTSAGQVESIKDARDCAQYFTYDCHHRMNSSRDGEGNTTYFDYDLVGNQDVVVDPRDNVTYTNYDQVYRFESTRNALGEQDYFYYDAAGNRTASEDALQHWTYFYYDARNRVEAEEDALQNRTYYTYEARGLRSSTEDARGFVSTFVYDAENRRTKSTTPLNEETYFGYDAAANQTAVVDARGNAGYFYYDTLNRAEAEEDAKQARTYFTFDASGNRVSTKDPLDRATYFAFDCAQRQFALQDALGGFQYFTYDPAGNRDSVKDPRANVTYSYFDALNRQFAERSPVGGLTYFEFDKAGNQSATKNPVGRVFYFSYDAADRQFAIEHPNNRFSYFAYDAVGNTESFKTRQQGAIEVTQYFTYDDLNRRSSFQNEAGDVWYFDYDASANLFVQENPRNALTYWEYDALNRKESQKDPLGRTWYWTYDAVGNVSGLKDGKAEVTYYQYDQVNLQDRVDYPDSTHHYFEYDLARQQTAMADPTGRTTFAYDDLSRMTERSNPGGENLYYEYDAAGNRTSLKDPDGVVIVSKFDAADRLAEVGSDGYGNQPYGRSPYGGYVAYYEYNLADEVVHDRRANKTLTYFGYDTLGHQARIEHRKGDGTEIADFENTWGTAPVLLQQVRSDISETTYWNYDAAGRIASEYWRTTGGVNVYGFEYSYDGAGNRIYRRDTVKNETTYWEYDLGDQVTTQKLGGDAKVTFTFDANGNVAVEDDVDAGKTYYDYEPRNLLTRVDFPGGTPTNYFYYNAISERVRKDGVNYTWDGIVPILQTLVSTGAMQQRMVKGYTPVEGIGEYAMQQIHSATVLWPHKNQVGTTYRLTDAAEAVDSYYEYDAWGVPLETNDASAQPYRFTGKELDPDSVASFVQNARYHYPLRTYVPSRGGFVQADPILYGILERTPRVFLQEYPYLAVASRPSVYVDPLGLELEAFGDAIKDLKALCPEADVVVTPSGGGKVSIRPPDWCDKRIPICFQDRFGNFLGGITTAPLATAHPAGCECICKAVSKPFLITVTSTRKKMAAFGGGRTDLHKQFGKWGHLIEYERRGEGAIYQVLKKGGGWIDLPPVVILGHELCGHSVPAKDAFLGTPMGGQVFSIQMENKIRAEQGLPGQSLEVEGERHRPKPK